MIRTALISLDQANKTNNYAVLRELGGPGLQAMSTSQLSDVFAELRTSQVDLSPVAIVTPQVSEPPAITPESLLNIVGYFPTQPMQVRFRIVFQPVEGRWKLFGLTVNLGPAAVAAASSETKPAGKKAKPAAKPAAEAPKQK